MRKGMAVFVYFNLHKRCWSIRDSLTGLVVGHADKVLLTDCLFKVSEPGRLRTIREKKKNVHAGIQGKLVCATNCAQKSRKLKTAVSYNPFRGPTFYRKSNGSKVFQSESAFLAGRVVFI